MGPYSLDLRQRIVDAYVSGEGSIRQLAKRFAVAPNTVQNYLTQLRATGTIVPLPHSGGVAPKIDQAGLELVSQLVAEKNDWTLAELAEQIERRLQVQVSVPTVHRALQRLRITRKKNTSSERAGPPDGPSSPRAVSAAGPGKGCATPDLLRRVRLPSRHGATLRSSASRAPSARQGAMQHRPEHHAGDGSEPRRGR
jgi:transposase